MEDLAHVDGGERRRAVRVSAHGTILFHGEQVAHARLLDLSRTRVRCRVTDGPVPPLDGATVRFALRVDGRTGGWLRLAGRVERDDGDGEVDLTIAAEHSEDHDAFCGALSAELQSASDRGDEAHILLIDPQPSRRLRYAEHLRAQGLVVTAVATPLEAIEHLGESASRPAVIAVADTDPRSIADELRAYLRDVHGEILLIPTRL